MRPVLPNARLFTGFSEMRSPLRSAALPLAPTQID
jgi:hypothetical protein